MTTLANLEGSEQGIRTGAYGLSLLARPLNVNLLRALADGTTTQMELRRATGSPAQSTLRSHLCELEAAGVIVKRKQNDFPGTLEYELLEAGESFAFVAETLERWLVEAPDGAIQLGTDPAKSEIKALLEGWSTTMLRTLAVEPRTLTELARLIPEVSYPSLERRLSTMRLVGQVTVLPGGGKGTPYAVTGWLRRGVAPLVASARWEERHFGDGAPAIDDLDVEAAFMLVLPMLRLPSGVSGECRLAVELSNGREPRRPGVRVEVEAGRIATCIASPLESAATWATGTAAGWLSAVIDAETDELDLGGDRGLLEQLLAGIHRALFEPGAPAGLDFYPSNN